MDGDGSVQVNHWKKKSLQYRLVIKLKNDPDKYNLSLLKKIEYFIGGTVRVESKEKFVLWVENRPNKISEIINIFEKYPPLTTRLSLQLQFLHSSLKKNDILWYLEERDKKYQYDKIERMYNKISNYKHFPHFNGWLSGFIEAEGYFTLRSNSSNNHSFSISQKCDKFLLEKINLFFKGKKQVRLVANKKKKISESKQIPNSVVENCYYSFYWLEIYNKEVLKKVVSHCISYPLYGEKQKSFLFFSKKIL